MDLFDLINEPEAPRFRLYEHTLNGAALSGRDLHRWVERGAGSELDELRGEANRRTTHAVVLRDGHIVHDNGLAPAVLAEVTP